MTKASEHDLNAVCEILPHLTNRALVGDKAYSREKLNEALQQQAGSYIYTPVKLVKGETQAIRQFKHRPISYFQRLFLVFASQLNLYSTGLLIKQLFNAHPAPNKPKFIQLIGSISDLLFSTLSLKANEEIVL